MSKVLIVDDNREVREMVAENLKAAGYDSVQASDGARAMGLLTDNDDISLVVSDMTLPSNLSGHYLIRLLRCGSKFDEIPLVVTSDVMGADSMELLQSLNQQNTRFVPKNQLATRICDVVRNLLAA